MTQIWWNNTLSFALQGFMGEASVRLKLLKISLSLCRERQNKSNIINAANGDPEGRPVAQSGWFEQLLYCQSQQKRQKSTDLICIWRTLLLPGEQVVWWPGILQRVDPASSDQYQLSDKYGKLLIVNKGSCSCSRRPQPWQDGKALCQGGGEWFLYR